MGAVPKVRGRFPRNGYTSELRRDDLAPGTYNSILKQAGLKG
jgi:hypothetical protein